MDRVLVCVVNDRTYARAIFFLLLEELQVEFQMNFSSQLILGRWAADAYRRFRSCVARPLRLRSLFIVWHLVILFANRLLETYYNFIIGCFRSSDKCNSFNVVFHDYRSAHNSQILTLKEPSALTLRRRSLRTCWSINFSRRATQYCLVFFSFCLLFSSFSMVRKRSTTYTWKLAGLESIFI